jgi:hypothetical protein
MYLNLKTRVSLSLVLAVSVTGLTASSASIGVATANGNFQVNSSQVRGSSTLMEGTVIETGGASSQVQMNNGAHVRVAAGSRVKIYEGRVILEKGVGELDSSTAYQVEAHSLRISNAGPDTVARVWISSPNRVIVSALKGPVRVTNAAGFLVANIAAGGALSFDPAVSATGPTKVTGCLASKDDKFVVTAESTNVTWEVRGAGVEKEVGKHVEITGASDSGSPTSKGVLQVINASAFKRVGNGGCSSKAAAAIAAGGMATAGGTAAAAGGTAAAVGGVAAAAAGATVAGVTVATVAVVGGVVVAGTAAGLAATGTFTPSATPVPKTSR